MQSDSLILFEVITFVFIITNVINVYLIAMTEYTSIYKIIKTQKHYENNVSGHLRNERESQKKDDKESVETKRRRLLCLSFSFHSNKKETVNLSFSFHSNKKETVNLSYFFIQTKRRRLISPFHFNQTKTSHSIFREKSYIKKMLLKKFISIIKGDSQSLLFISFKHKGDG